VSHPSIQLATLFFFDPESQTRTARLKIGYRCGCTIARIGCLIVLGDAVWSLCRGAQVGASQLAIGCGRRPQHGTEMEATQKIEWPPDFSQQNIA
jgi:hypothetical protein